MKTLLPLFILLSASLLPAAEGSVHGRVYGQDESGENLGPVANAKIELQTEAGTAAATVTTNEYGYYQIPTLAVGAYRYKVSATGFRAEDEKRGFAMPHDTREFVHDFLLTREAKPRSGSPAQSNIVRPAVHGRVYGQTEKGENLGPLPGAKVEILSGPGGAAVATATANSPGGYYEIKNLPPADYAYRVTAAGFGPEDAGRGFTVPKSTLEYVHDFLLSKVPPKRDKCDLAVLVVKRISSGGDRSQDARIPVANARIVLQPQGNLPTPLNQPFTTDARGEYNAKDLAEGSYNVAIDGPECEPFNGTLAVKCDKNGDVIFELQPCNEILHSYVRVMLTDGWGNTPQTKAAADRGYQRATKVDAKDGGVNYAAALAQLSAGDYPAAQQSLATAIGKKSNATTWDRACEARVWMTLCLHQPAQAMREIRSLAQKHDPARSSTPAAKDAAAVCGIGLGLIKGPWKDLVGAGDAVVLENELRSAFKGDLQAECMQARDHVAQEYGKLKAAEDAARSQLMAGINEKRNAQVAAIAERQTALNKEVALLDPEIQTLQATVAQFDQQYRIQVTGFMQQQQANAVQLQALNGRLQQIGACMAQDQVRMQAAAQQQQQMPQTTTTQPGMRDTVRPGMRPGVVQPAGAGTQAIMVEIQQHQLEIAQIRQQMQVIQNQDVQMGANIANLQAQFKRSAGTAQADLETKSRQREGLAREFENLERQRTAPFDPTSFSTPEIDNLVRRGRSLKTYRDFPLEVRREEVLNQFNCGVAKEPKRIANGAPAAQINEPAFTSAKAPASNAPSPTPSVMRAQPAYGNTGVVVPPPTSETSGMPPFKQSPPATAVAATPANAGDPAEVVVTNNHTGALRVFSLAPGADNELFVRSLEAGEEFMIPTRIGQTLILRSSAGGGRELQRHKVGKKLEVLKVGTAPP